MDKKRFDEIWETIGGIKKKYNHDAGWDETKHDRDKSGRFTSGGGSMNSEKFATSAAAAAKDMSIKKSFKRGENGIECHINLELSDFGVGSKWAKVVKKSSGEKMGDFGHFEVYKNGDGYEAVMKKGIKIREDSKKKLNNDGAPYGNKNAAGPRGVRKYINDDNRTSLESEYGDDMVQTAYDLIDTNVAGGFDPEEVLIEMEERYGDAGVNLLDDIGWEY